MCDLAHKKGQAMNTNEILSGLNEAITAYHKVPELERELRTITEDRDYTKLELDDARAEIQRLRDQITNLNTDLAWANNTITEANATIADLRDRNNNLDESINRLTESHSNLLRSHEERCLEIESQRLTIESLSSRLEDSASLTDRLKETLRSIGQRIVETVAEPEVSPTAPFPVPVTVELPVSADAADGGNNNPAPVEPLVTPTGEDMGMKEAAGCFPYLYW
jgi:chromosome segregation ATPase